MSCKGGSGDTRVGKKFWIIFELEIFELEILELDKFELEIMLFEIKLLEIKFDWPFCLVSLFWISFCTTFWTTFCTPFCTPFCSPFRMPVWAPVRCVLLRNTLAKTGLKVSFDFVFESSGVEIIVAGPLGEFPSVGSPFFKGFIAIAAFKMCALTELFSRILVRERDALPF